jgi:hypothetical protein
VQAPARYSFFGRAIPPNPILHSLLVANEIEFVLYDFVGTRRTIEWLTVGRVRPDIEPMVYLIMPDVLLPNRLRYFFAICMFKY